jgi:hypothetical protein
MTRKFVFMTICLLLTGAVITSRAADLVFSEFMYNPLPSSTNAADDDQFEFLELRNTSASPINLGGAYFSAGITFTFPTGTNLAAGAYGLLVRNVASMTNRYGSLTNILGVYTGKLANEGETVTLRKGDGTILFSVSYGDAFPWPEAPDGEGASLVLTAPNGDPNSPGSWAASDAFQGTPGRTGIGAAPNVVINEILAHTDPPDIDSVELLNTTTQAVSVLGWYLSDDPVQRRKYRLTNTAAIPPGGFLVLTTNQFDSPTAAASNRFSLSELGETVYLTSSNLARFADYVKFGASSNGVSLGRSPDGWGGFTFMVTNTPGYSNGLAKVGPMVISEIMYHPASDSPAEEFIELLNITASPAPLYDTARLTNTWKLASAVGYLFPTNITVPAGGRLLVTGATNLTAFRTTYSVPTNIPIYGPWTGQLDNAGDSVRLYMPGVPEPTGFVPQILVDRVDYLDAAPWPTAPDGSGPSLERRVATNTANGASNWFVGPPGGSPGAAPAGGFFTPLITPAVPATLQTFTVTVAVVAQPLPTQVVCRTVINGVTNNRVMNDAGLTGDAVASNQVYTTVVAGLSSATWMYYAFDGYSSNGAVFSLPESEVEYLPAPTVTLKMCNNGLAATVAPQAHWTACLTTGLVTDADCFQVYLNGAGEVLLDDVYLLDGGGTNHLGNSEFSAALPGSGWLTNSGNHQASAQEVPWDEAGNGVLHVRATGEGNVTNFFDSLSAFFTPDMQIGTPAALSFQVRQASRKILHWSWVQVGNPPPEVILNEVMYHPVQTNEADYEYVELFNPATVAVDVSGWDIEGTGFTLPVGTSLAPTGYLVCAANTSAVMTLYGITNAIGNWTGTLQNDGETLVLKTAQGRELDRLTYDDFEPWPIAADGYGPSLERVNPAWAGNTSLNWTASAAGTNWQQVVLTNAVGTNAILSFFLDYDGKCWMDDVSVKAVGSAVELASNGTFETGMPGWTATNNHAQSRTEAGMGRGGGQALALVGNASRWTPGDPPRELILYGDGSSNRVYSTPLPAQAGTNYVLSWWVRRQGLGDNVYGVVGSVTGKVSFTAQGSPGRLNSAQSSLARFGLEQGARSFDVGTVGSTNIIRARITPAGAATNVQFRYREVGSNTYHFSDAQYTSLTMRDDGVAPDSVASDGEYACEGPPATSAWTLVRYQILALGTNGVAATRPAQDDPSTDYAYWIQGIAVQTNMPDWHMMMDGNPLAYPFVRRACVVSPNGQAFTDVSVRHRGRIESGNTTFRTGVAVRMHRGRLLNAWFANKQGGINFRNRMYANNTDYTRVVNEWLGYELQRVIGLPAPRTRHVCLWLNGAPTVTVELEDPEEDFLKGNGIDKNDYVSRAGWTGRNLTGGDPALDNLDAVNAALNAADGAAKTDLVRTNLWYDSIQPCLALLAMTANADQFFVWNMFQHRRVSDGRWEQFPWDVDMSFRTDTIASEPNTNILTQLHPYYQTPLHPSIWDHTPPPSFAASTLGETLFYPESGPGSEYTLPYRHRQQMTLWRYFHTLQTTNYLFPKLDTFQAQLLPAFVQLGLSRSAFTNQVVSVKQAILDRRTFLQNGTWSDKNTTLWNPTNVYVTTNVVINEIMCDPPAGGEYLELYNRGGQAVDLSQWTLQAGSESYRLPFGTMLGATSYLVVADSQPALTNYFTELVSGNALIQRYPGTPIWDGPLVWTSATEYASRVIEIPSLTLPNTGASISLSDLAGTVIDAVTYGVTLPWPTNLAASFELINAGTDNNTGTAWRSSVLVGTPGWVNTAAADRDADTLPDAWEQGIVDSNPADGITNVTNVLGTDDFDQDGVLNAAEYVAGTDPTSDDAATLRLRIAQSNGVIAVEFDTLPLQGDAYQAFDTRRYTLDWQPQLLLTNNWGSVTNFTGLTGIGQTILYTNALVPPSAFYRYRIELHPRR